MPRVLNIFFISINIVFKQSIITLLVNLNSDKWPQLPHINLQAKGSMLLTSNKSYF